ncbi:MAG TPA: hypothetical protein VF901_14130 [Bradyrhizobium sp.]
MAPFGNLSAAGLATGVGGGETIASRKYALCKFMVINLRSSKIQSEFEIATRASQTARSFSNRARILGKIGKRFNRQDSASSKVDRLG